MVTPIKKIFVLMFENRSFDHMLGSQAMSGWQPNGEPTTLDVRNPDAANCLNEACYKVGTSGPFAMPYDPGHEFADVQEQLHGEVQGGAASMSGFVASANKTAEPAGASPGLVLQSFTAQELPVLHQLAREFAVCDRWFASMPGPTWPNRFFAHAATSGGLDASPTSLRETLAYTPFDGYEFQNGTIFESLERAGKPWRIYHGDSFPQSAAIKGMSLKLAASSEFSSYENFERDVVDLKFSPSYIFIEPNYGHIFSHGADMKCGNSQHPLNDVTCGDGLLKGTYEAIRKSPHWDNSLFIVAYDEHGGFYDHVMPGSAVPPGDKSKYNTNGFRFDSYGVRVPAIVISPLIRRNTIDHSNYDHSSILKTVESLFGLNALTERDRQAEDLMKLLTLGGPRTDTPVILNEPASSGLKECSDPTNLNLPVALSSGRESLSKPIDPSLDGTLTVALLHDLALSPQDAESIRENFSKLRTRGDGLAYLRAVTQKAVRNVLTRKTGA